MKLALALAVVVTLLFGISSTSNLPDSVKLFKYMMPQVNKILGKNYTFVEEIYRMPVNESGILGSEKFHSLIQTTLKHGDSANLVRLLTVYFECPVVPEPQCAVRAASEMRK